MVRRGEIPADIETVALPEGVRTPAGLRIDRLLPKIGLAESVSDATRKIKAKAVEINGELVHDLAWNGSAGEMIVRTGKQWRRVTA